MQTKKRLLIASLTQQKKSKDLIDDLKFLIKLTVIMVTTIFVCVMTGFWLYWKLSLGQAWLIIGAIVGLICGILIGWNVLRKFVDKRYD